MQHEPVALTQIMFHTVTWAQNITAVKRKTTQSALTGCHSQPDVPVSQCPPYWWTLQRRWGLRTAWRALSEPPGERRCRGTGSSPGADGQHEPVSNKENMTFMITSPHPWIHWSMKVIFNKTCVKGAPWHMLRNAACLISCLSPHRLLSNKGKK